MSSGSSKPGFWQQKCWSLAAALHATATASKSQDASVDSHIKGTIDYCTNPMSAMVTPKPCFEDQEKLVSCLPDWLSKQSLKDTVLSQWDTKKHDTFEAVNTAAMDHVTRLNVTGWLVPFEDEPLAGQELGCPPMPTNHPDPELTTCHWGSQSDTCSRQDAIQNIKTQSESSQNVVQGPAPSITTVSATQTSDLNGSNWIPKRPERIDSAPYYNAENENQPLNGESFARIWGA